MLADRRRRWTSIVPTLSEGLVFVGLVRFRIKLFLELPCANSGALSSGAQEVLRQKKAPGAYTLPG